MFSYLRRLATFLVFSTYYNLKLGFFFCLYYVTHPLSDPWTPKRRLMPPEPLRNPKYGVHKNVKVNNIKMHYVESGDPSKELMIFVHGFPEFWYSWRHQIEEFQKDYWVIAVDMRGYGDSEKPENVSDYKLPILADDFKDLIKYLGREKCIMVAHDWGAIVGWAFRRRYPQMLKALISMGGTSLEALDHLIWNNPEQFKRSWYIFLFQGFWVPEMMLCFDDLGTFNKIFGEMSNVTKEDVECYKYAFGKPGAATPPINYYRSNFVDPPQIAINEATQVPSLFISGGADEALLVDNGKVTKEIFKETEWVVVKNFRHFMQQENPIEVNAMMRNFLMQHKL